MVSQTPKDTPFGLEPNVAAGLAYLFTLIGGIVMLVGGGTNKFVKWAACQAIVTFVVMFVLSFAAGFVGVMVHFYMLGMLVNLLYLIIWLYQVIFAFQGKEVQIPVISNLTQQIFGSQLA